MTSDSVQNGERLSQNKSRRNVRPITELWEMWKPRVKMRIYPFAYASYEDMERVMTSLTSYDRDTWAAAFSSVAKPYEVKASQAEKTGDAQKRAMHKWSKKTIFEHTSITGSHGTRQLIRLEKRRRTGSPRKCSLRLRAILTFQ